MKQAREAEREMERYKSLAEERERVGQNLEASLQKHMAACGPRASTWAQREACLIAEASEARKAAANARSSPLSLCACVCACACAKAGTCAPLWRIRMCVCRGLILYARVCACVCACACADACMCAPLGRIRMCVCRGLIFVCAGVCVCLRVRSRVSREERV